MSIPRCTLSFNCSFAEGVQSSMSDSFLDHAVRASLVDMLDKRVLIVLRDNRKLIGWLR